VDVRSHRFLVAALVPLLAGTLLSGCGLLSRPPDGFQETSADDVSFVYPETWREATPKASNSGVAFAAELRRGGRTVAQVAVLEDITDQPDVVFAAHTAIAGMQMTRPEFHVKELDDIDVEGADDARRLNYTYSVTGKGETATPARGIDITTLGPYQAPVVVRVNWLTGHVPPATIEQIVTSVSVG
jgi:hypothetical protein